MPNEDLKKIRILFGQIFLEKKLKPKTNHLVNSSTARFRIIPLYAPYGQ